jgi:nickel-dependent lactate racemase
MSYIEVELPQNTFLVLSRLPSGFSEEQAKDVINNAIRMPIESESLESLTRGCKNITILITDKTRPTPNKLILPILLRHLHSIGVKKEMIKIIIATGLHKPHTWSEILELVGREIADEYEIYSHNAEDKDNLVYLGTTTFNTKVYVNKDVVRSDLVIGVGLLEPHYFAGYSGGRKLILPGVSGAETIWHNHSFKMLSHPKAISGVLEGNPVHEDMVEAAKMVRSYRFIVHVILDKEKRIVRAFSGDPYEAHRINAQWLSKYVVVPVPFEADVSIVSNAGYPLDRNLYQANKGIVTASRVTRRGGVIILLAECRDGVEHEHFRKLLSMSKNPEEILRYIERNEPLRDQDDAQLLAQVLLKNRVIVVTKWIKHSILEEMNLIPASTFEEALELACRYVECKRIVAIPEGPYVIPTLTSQ